jgi:NAD(P)-dependent dehydrogenase (short-subunit alcohol dehydrogenase family)
MRGRAGHRGFLTGASRGLGRAIGEVALAAGQRVVLTALRSVVSRPAYAWDRGFDSV